MTVTLGKKPAAPAAGLENPGEPPGLTPPATPAPPWRDRSLAAAAAMPSIPRASLELPPLPVPATPAIPGTPAPPSPTTPPSLDLPSPTPAPTIRRADTVSLGPGFTGRFGLAGLSDELRVQYGIRPTVTRGAVIIKIRAGGPADTAGLPLGGVIVQINGVKVDNADDLINVVSSSRPGQEVEISYYTRERLTRKTVKLRH